MPPDYDETNIDAKRPSKGPYGSHTVRQVLSRNQNTPSRQIKQDSIDSEKSGKFVKGTVGLDDLMDGRKPENFNSHIRYLNHLQRSADSGFASTEVEAQQQARLKPLMRQTSVQENKEYEMEMAELCSSKTSSKSELNYRDFNEENTSSHVRKTYREDMMFRDPIPEIKVQSNFSPKENEQDGILLEAVSAPEDFRDQLTEVVTTIAQKHWEQQAKSKVFAKQGNQRSDNPRDGNELLQSIKMDLSSATHKSQHSPGYPSPLAQLRKRESQKGKTSKTGERMSTDSFSDIPLPPASMLSEKQASQYSTPSPPLPTPPPEMLTDTEESTFSFSSFGHVQPEDPYESKARTFTTQSGDTSAVRTRSEIPESDEVPIGHGAKPRKPQISRIPAVTASNSPVKHANPGSVQTNIESSMQSRSVKVKPPAVSKRPPNELYSEQPNTKGIQGAKDHRTHPYSQY